MSNRAVCTACCAHTGKGHGEEQPLPKACLIICPALAEALGTVRTQQHPQHLCLLSAQLSPVAVTFCVGGSPTRVGLSAHLPCPAFGPHHVAMLGITQRTGSFISSGEYQTASPVETVLPQIVIADLWAKNWMQHATYGRARVQAMFSSCFYSFPDMFLTPDGHQADIFHIVVTILMCCSWAVMQDLQHAAEWLKLALVFSWKLWTCAKFYLPSYWAVAQVLLQVNFHSLNISVSPFSVQVTPHKAL